MNNGWDKSIAFLLVGVFFTLLAPEMSHATWYWTHGNSGNPATALAYSGEGLKIEGGEDGTMWVHYAVPTVGETDHKVRYIKVRYSRFNYAGITNIAAIHIYNGETKVKEFTSGWPPVTYPSVPELCEPVLDLVTAQAFDKGLGVSIAISSDFNSGTEWITIHGVGANFEAPAQANTSSSFYVIPVKKNP